MKRALVANYGSSSSEDERPIQPSTSKEPHTTTDSPDPTSAATNGTVIEQGSEPLATVNNDVSLIPQQQFNREREELRQLLRPSTEEIDRLKNLIKSSDSVVIDLQSNVDGWLQWSANTGQTISQHLQSNRSLRNPAIQSKLIEYLDLNEFDTGFGLDSMADGSGTKRPHLLEQMVGMQRLPAEAFFDYADQFQRRREEEQKELAMRRARGEDVANRRSIQFKSNTR
jgi:hypothetical protein